MTTGANGNERRRLLRSIPIFQGLNPSQLDKVSKFLRKVAVPQGVALLQQGEPGGALFILLSGEVEVRRKPYEGAEDTLVAVLKPKQAFGEMALMDDAPRAASVIATKSSILFLMTREDWEQLVFVDKDIGYQVLWSLVRMLADRLRKTEPAAVPIISTGF